MARDVTWALVSNGVRARILRGLDDGGSGDPIDLAGRADSTHPRDMPADKVGRSFASAGGGRRSAMEPGSDAAQRDMQDFARETLDLLDRHLRAGRLTRLAIFAAPKMLGILRAEMPDSVRKAVFLERDVNLLSLPEAELRETILEALATEVTK